MNSFLPLCLRSPWDPAALPAARALAADLDVAALLQTAQAEGLAPLLYSIVRGQQLLPPPAEAALRQAYYGSAHRNLLLLHELEEVLCAFATARIPVIVLKGAALGPAIYANPAARPLGDLDLLLHPADVPAAQRILAARGYRAPQQEARPEALLDYENELMLRQEGPPGAAVEIHWSLLDSPHHQRRLPLEWFWATAQPLSLGATSALMLGPEAQLLHLCAHLVLHHGSADLRLLWLHDIAAVIVHYQQQLDWDALLAQAQACDLVLPVQQLLPAIARDWHAPIPATALAELARLRPSPAEVRVHAQLTAPGRPAGRRFWDDLSATPTWRQRLRFAWAGLFPAPAYMRQRYRIRSPLLLPLYYPYRWLLGFRGLLFRTQP